MHVLRLKETMLMNKAEFLEKTVFFLVRPETYWVVFWVHTDCLNTTAQFSFLSSSLTNKHLAPCTTSFRIMEQPLCPPAIPHSLAISITPGRVCLRKK